MSRAGGRDVGVGRSGRSDEGETVREDRRGDREKGRKRRRRKVSSSGRRRRPSPRHVRARDAPLSLDERIACQNERDHCSRPPRGARLSTAHRRRAAPRPSRRPVSPPPPAPETRLIRRAAPWLAVLSVWRARGVAKLVETWPCRASASRRRGGRRRGVEDPRLLGTATTCLKSGAKRLGRALWRCCRSIERVGAACGWSRRGGGRRAMSGAADAAGLGRERRLDEGYAGA